MRLQKSLIFLFLLNAPHRAEGEILNCNGILTNKPCNGGIKVLEETHSPAPSEEELKERKIKNWLLRLETARLKVQNDYGIQVDSSLTEEICRKGSLLECEQALLSKESEINKRILDALSIQEKEQNIEAVKEQQKADSETPPSQTTTIVHILNDHSDNIFERRRISVGRPHRHHHEPESPPTISPPLLPPPSFIPPTIPPGRAAISKPHREH